MLLLHTADWHLGRRLEGKNRHDEQREVMQEICSIAESEDVEAVLIAGDIYDTYNPPAESESLYYETVARLSDGGRRAVVVIAGNHDSPDRLKASDPYGRALGVVTLGFPYDVAQTFDRGSGKIACLEGATGFARLRLRNGEHLNVLALPYPSEARLRRLLSDRIEEEEAGINYDRTIRELLAEGAKNFRDGEANVVMSHLFVRGGAESESERQIQVGGAHSVSSDSFPPEAAYVALGHLHRPQEFSSRSSAPIRYAGSPLQYSFSEAEQQKFVSMIEFDGGTATHRAVPLSSGRTLISRKGLKGIEELERFLAECDPDAWITFKVQLEEALPIGYVDQLHQLHRGILVPVFDYKKNSEQGEDSVSLTELSIEEQFRRFLRSRGEVPNDEIVELFLKLADEQVAE